MVLIDLLNRELEEIAAAEPQPVAKRKVGFVDPLRAYPLGRQELADMEADSRIGRMLTRKSWEGF